MVECPFCDEYGYVVDYVTGRKFPDTPVERVRQKLERFLVEIKGYSKEDIEVDVGREIVVDSEKVDLRAELVVNVEGKRFMVIKCEPPTRFIIPLERRTISIARLLFSTLIPIAVLTNGNDTEVIDAITGKIIGESLAEIPSKDEAIKMLGNINVEELPEEKIEKEKRILATFTALRCEKCGVNG